MAKKSDKSNSGWYFLITVILIYIILLFINYNSFIKAISMFSDIIVKIIPVFFIVFILMALMNYFVTSETIVKHLQDKKIKSWLIAVFGGIISHGPIYMWYPLLKDAKKKGVKDSLISCFLYNRAVKIPLLPLIIFYFGGLYVLILTIIMIIFSIIGGVILEKILQKIERRK
jgi:uncharacterized membrane protein YraQ (UPF0718 family)